jgi:hypothetical protein
MHKEFDRRDMERRLYNVLRYFTFNNRKTEHEALLGSYNSLKVMHDDRLGELVGRYESLAKKMEEQKGVKEEGKASTER